MFIFFQDSEEGFRPSGIQVSTDTPDEHLNTDNKVFHHSYPCGFRASLQFSSGREQCVRGTSLPPGLSVSPPHSWLSGS